MRQTYQDEKEEDESKNTSSDEEMSAAAGNDEWLEHLGRWKLMHAEDIFRVGRKG